MSCQNCTAVSSNHLPGPCIFQWQNSLTNRFMVCMGGPAGNWTPNPTMRHRTDTEYTVCYAQYITTWPLTHPRCAAAFFNFSIARDRRQRNQVSQKALHHLTSITDIWISLDCYAYDFLKVEQAVLVIVAEITGLPLKWFPNFFLIHHVLTRHVLRCLVSRWHYVSHVLVWGWNWCPGGLNSKKGKCNTIHTHAKMNTIMCEIITKNVKHCMFSLCLLQRHNNGCDFVPLSCVSLEYHHWLGQ